MNILDWNGSGDSYQLITKTLKGLKEKTNIYLKIENNNVKGVRMTQLFSKIDIYETGEFSFTFEEEMLPMLIDLKENYFYFKIEETVELKSKYSIILFKLWESYRFKNTKSTVINDSLENWEGWFLGNRDKMSAGRFKDKILNVAMKELSNKKY